MKNKLMQKYFRWFSVCYLVLMAVIYWQMVPYYSVRTEETDMNTPTGIVGEIVDGKTIEQKFVSTTNSLDSLRLLTATFNRVNTGTMHFVIYGEDGAILSDSVLDVQNLNNDSLTNVPLSPEITDCQGKILTLKVFTEGASDGHAPTLYFGTSDETLPSAAFGSYTVNGKKENGQLCLTVRGTSPTNVGPITLGIMVVLYAALLLAYFIAQHKEAKGKPSVIGAVCGMLEKYNFLMRQLVGRDFKTKYKRSILGVAWSFLNPFLTMAVQYIVFSTLFKSDTPNYPLYLLTGVVFFSFFSEACSTGLGAITANASLIKKVYIPKYIYPISKTLSSLVNFGFSLIPILIVMLVTRTPFRLSLLLLVYDVLCMLLFLLGMAFLLSTMMTFFQDTQFLWGVASMMWMYFTPIFYTENIIPASMRTLYHMNPLYQYVSFARVCIIDGISPVPMQYIYCAVSGFVVFVTGLMVFRKHQDDFIFHL